MVKRNRDPISNSDWIIFLQGKITTLIGVGLPLLAAYLLITITVIQINLQLEEDQMPTTISGISVFLLFIFFFMLFTIWFAIAPISRLQRRIIKGELTSHKKILKIYVEEIENKNFFSTIKDEVERRINSSKKKNKKQ